MQIAMLLSQVVCAPLSVCLSVSMSQRVNASWYITHILATWSSNYKKAQTFNGLIYFHPFFFRLFLSLTLRLLSVLRFVLSIFSKCKTFSIMAISNTKISDEPSLTTWKNVSFWPGNNRHINTRMHRQHQTSIQFRCLFYLLASIFLFFPLHTFGIFTRLIRRMLCH